MTIGLLAAAFAAHAETTFYRDVLPLLQKRCQSCHRTGEAGAMPLVTYEQTRPWAKAIRQAVTLRKMPPWFADPHFGAFANDPSLTAAEIVTIESWVDAGAPAGLKNDAPPPAAWPVGSVLPNANVVTAMPHAFAIPAGATIPYQYFTLNPGFAADTWATAIEIRPSDRSVVHHAVLYVREPGIPWDTSHPITADILAIYSPGAPATICPEGMAKKIPAGSDLVLQMHYTSKPNRAVSDRTEVRIVKSPARPRLRLMTLQMSK